jgi:hypothetical protein
MSKMIDFRHRFHRSEPELVTLPVTFLGFNTGDFIVKTRRLTCLKCGKVVRISLSARAGTLGRDFQVVRELGGWIVRSLDRLPDDLLLTRCLVGSVEEHDL